MKIEIDCTCLRIWFLLPDSKNETCYYVSLIFLAGLDLESGVQYIVIVRAMNFAGLQIEAALDGFAVDFTPPEISEAIIGTGPEPAEYQSDMKKMTIRYRIVFPQSESASLCLYSSLTKYKCTMANFLCDAPAGNQSSCIQQNKNPLQDHEYNYH